jgi:hypothetical protein
VAQLLATPFGKPSVNHSFTQTAAFDTVIFYVLKSSFLDRASLNALYEAHEIYKALATTMDEVKEIDFRPLAKYDPNWESQEFIPIKKKQRFTACLFHYGL